MLSGARGMSAEGRFDLGRGGRRRVRRRQGCGGHEDADGHPGRSAPCHRGVARLLGLRAVSLTKGFASHGHVYCERPIETETQSHLRLAKGMSDHIGRSSENSCTWGAGLGLGAGAGCSAAVSSGVPGSAANGASRAVPARRPTDSRRRLHNGGRRLCTGAIIRLCAERSCLPRPGARR